MCASLAPVVHLWGCEELPKTPKCAFALSPLLFLADKVLPGCNSTAPCSAKTPLVVTATAAAAGTPKKGGNQSYAYTLSTLTLPTTMICMSTERGAAEGEAEKHQQHTTLTTEERGPGHGWLPVREANHPYHICKHALNG